MAEPTIKIWPENFTAATTHEWAVSVLETRLIGEELSAFSDAAKEIAEAIFRDNQRETLPAPVAMTVMAKSMQKLAADLEAGS